MYINRKFDMKIKYLIISAIIFGLIISTNKTYAIEYDIDKVRETRLWWNNDLRSDLWLDSYKLDNKLNETATTWSNYLWDLWYWTHKRSSKDGYYNYNSVKNWFNRQWITFLWQWTQFVENIWYGYVNCKDSECTDEVISAIKTTRDFYISEKNKKYASQRAHYNSLINKYYDRIGIGIKMVWKKYYLTIHYTVDGISYEGKDEDNKNIVTQTIKTTTSITPKIIRKKKTQ